MKIETLKGNIPDSVFNELPLVMEKFKINTPLRLSHFLSQSSHESNNFKATRENLNYSADGLLTVFGKYFNTATAKQYARKPEMIASKVYANRMGNGSETTKDGWIFRGAGFIQLTGKDNFAKFDTFVDDDIISNPSLVATKYPLLSAAWFFHNNNLNVISDKGSSNTVITQLTKRINGGTNGLDDRISKFNKFYNLLK
jgi:putative chitinase